MCIMMIPVALCPRIQQKQMKGIIKQQYQEKGDRSHRDRHCVCACLFFAENYQKCEEKMSISVHEFLTVARESEGVKEVAMLCEKLLFSG